MKRRAFLGTLIGALAAPAVVRAESLMKIMVPNRALTRPGDCVEYIEYNAGWLRHAEFIEKMVRPPMVANAALRYEPVLIIPGHITYVDTPTIFPVFSPCASNWR